MLTWDKPNERYYQHGLDRGVLYIPGKDPVPWNGLTGLTEGSNSTSSVLYRDGVIFLADADAGDFSAQMTAMFYPNAFAECLGIPEVADGLYVDNQKPKRFGLSYRSLVGSGMKGDMFGYQIHLVYNAMASIGSVQRQTLGKAVDPVEFTFDLVCTPVRLPGYRPSAHYIIDTRFMSKSTVTELEEILYGTSETPGSLPDPLTLFDLMNFGDAIVITVHTNGNFTVSASSSNLEEIDSSHFVMRNINGIDNGDGTYVISDGGNTDVIIEA